MQRILWLVGLCFLASGCRLIENGARTLIVEPLHYCAPFERYATRRQHQQLASSAWAELQSNDPFQSYSPDHAQGFVEGYVDYLDAGGTGHPPPLPPRRYWKSDYQTPAGQQAMLDWFAGFQHGAAMAKASGYRQLSTVPLWIPESPLPHASHPVLPTGPEPERIETPQPTPVVPPPPPQPADLDPAPDPKTLRPMDEDNEPSPSDIPGPDLSGIQRTALQSRFETQLPSANQPLRLPPATNDQ